MKKIMVIGAGEFQIPLIKACKEKGYFIIATDGNPNAEGFNYSDIPLNIDTLDKDLTLKKAKEYEIDGILTTSDHPVRTVAYVCEKLNLPGVNLYSAEIATNKFLLRECLKRNNIESPKYYIINSKTDINNLLHTLFFPLVVKPSDSSASRGVQKVSNNEELLKAYEEALSYSKCGSVVIEEFLDGPEFSVESLTQNGKTHIIAITEKTTTGLPYFVEERHVIPANITEVEENEIKHMVNKVIYAIGIDNSACHTEIKLTSKGVRIIEVGPRLGGDYITSDLVPLATGVSMLDNILRIALGLNIEIDNTANNYAGIQFITRDNYELILNNIDRLKQDTNIVKFKINDRENSKSLKNSLDREGYYICVSKDKTYLYNTLDAYKK